MIKKNIINDIKTVKKETVSKDGLLSLAAAHDVNGEPTRFKYPTFIHIDDINMFYVCLYAVATHLYYKDIDQAKKENIIEKDIISEAESVGIDPKQILGLLNHQWYKEFSSLLLSLK